MAGTINGIILAAGKGTRIGSKEINKVALTLADKPLIVYAVDLLESLVDRIIVVVGAFEQSVRDALLDKNVAFVRQNEQLGTAHAVQIALNDLDSNTKLILVGMGDHMMFYQKKTIQNLIDLHKQEKAVISFITTKYTNPDTLQWGLVERDKSGNVINIVEQKETNEKQRKIQELNAGFYCFDFDFLKKYIGLVKKSKITGEYYLTEIISLAFKENLKVVGMPVEFSQVGVGINRGEDFDIIFQG